MKKSILLIFMLLGFISVSFGQALLVDDFNYANGSGLIGQGGWTISGTSVVNPVTVVDNLASGLSYTGYAGSQVGLSVPIANTGQDVYTSYTPQTSGSVYLSFLANFSDVKATGDYFIAFSSSTAQTNYVGRLHVKSTTGGYFVGVKKSNETNATYGTTVLSLNVTYLFVMKYTFNSGTTTDDILNIFVFADPVLPSSEPLTPEIANYNDAAKTDATDMGNVTLRQGSATVAPTLVIDGIRVATTWSNSPLPVELTSFTAKTTKAGVMLNWTTATEVNNFGFDVESKLASAKEWKKVGFVEGHGNSNSPKEYSFFDNSGATSYRLKQVDFNGNFEYSDVVTVSSVITKTELYQNSPNPFNPSTKISFSLAETGKVNVSVYNVIGQKVADLVNQTMESGVHNVDFNASNLPSGLYIYRLETPNYSKTMKMMLLK